MKVQFLPPRPVFRREKGKDELLSTRPLTVKHFFTASSSVTDLATDRLGAASLKALLSVPDSVSALVSGSDGFVGDGTGVGVGVGVVTDTASTLRAATVVIPPTSKLEPRGTGL